MFDFTALFGGWFIGLLVGVGMHSLSFISPLKGKSKITIENLIDIGSSILGTISFEYFNISISLWIGYLIGVIVFLACDTYLHSHGQ